MDCVRHGSGIISTSCVLRSQPMRCSGCGEVCERRQIGIPAALRRAPAMLEALGSADLMRGAGMLTGIGFRIPDGQIFRGVHHD